MFYYNVTIKEMLSKPKVNVISNIQYVALSLGCFMINLDFCYLFECKTKPYTFLIKDYYSYKY